MAEDTPDSSDPESNGDEGRDPREDSEEEALTPDDDWATNASANLNSISQAYIRSIANPALKAVEFANQSAIDSVLSSIKNYYPTNFFLDSIKNYYPSPEYFSGINAVLRELRTQPSLSLPDDFDRLDEPAGSYSPELVSPGTYFESTEHEINSFRELNDSITDLIDKTPELPLVWRGVSKASWGLYSSLYRYLVNENGVEDPQGSPQGDQPYPDEDQMVEAEKEILRLARTDWRFDGLSALETFARLQHVGGPTRLIDVTKNPYVGAWFAVEFNEKHNEEDGRLFALATKPVRKVGAPEPPDGTVHLDSLGADRDPFWHHLPDHKARQGLDWGTGARRRLWVPPAYDPRISAQNAAFILDGVPMTTAETAPYFRIGNGNNKRWKRADLLAASSIYTKMSSVSRKPQFNARNFSPTFSFRITPDAKEDIREVLESRFGYRTSYIYPDMQALADHLNKQPLAPSPDER